MQEEPINIIKLDASSRFTGALKGEAIVHYAEPLIIRALKARSVGSWKPPARPPCWVVAESEDQRVKINEIKSTIILFTD